MQSPGILPDSAASAPLVEQLLARIEADIKGGKIKPGSFMGTRRDLCSAYDVTPDIFFQAVRVLEARGMVEARAGSGGGLFVTQNSMGGCARRFGTYLEFIGVDFDDTAPVSALLQGMCVRSGVDNVSVATAEPIKAKVRALAGADGFFERSRLLAGLFEAFADAGRNPFLSLYYRIVTNVMLDITRIDEPDREGHAPLVIIVDSCRKIAEAVIARDQDAASSHYLMFRHSLDVRHEIRDRGVDARTDGQDLPFDPSGGSKGTLSARLARHILKQVRQRRWPVGQKLGTEPELLESYGVSRTTFRQAIRLLEEYSAVETRRGPKGGLLIASPNASSLNQAAIALLKADGATIDDAHALLSPLVLLALTLAWDNRREAVAAAAKQARTTARADPVGAVRALIDALVGSSQNKTLGLLVHITLDFMQDLDADIGSDEALREGITIFADAIGKGDRAMARCALADLIMISP